MTDDIVTRLRIQTAHKIDVVSQLDMKCLCCPCCEESCIYCEAIYEFDRAADEIERLRALADTLATALQLQCDLHRIPVTTKPYYTVHATNALGEYKAVRYD